MNDESLIAGAIIGSIAVLDVINGKYEGIFDGVEIEMLRSFD